MTKMTRNEYKEYLKACANRMYTESGYTMKDYKTDADSIEIVPLDLSRFPAISEEHVKWINKLFDEEDVDRNGNYMLRGFTRQESAEVNALGCSFGDYANCYSFFAYNKAERYIYTYCEGDTTLTIYPDAESYRKGYEETYAWYKEVYA